MRSRQQPYPSVPQRRDIRQRISSRATDSSRGSVYDLVFSVDPEQSYVFLVDGANNQVVTLARENGAVLSKWSQSGRMAGQFLIVHNIAIDSKGNLYTAEVGFGRRTQKFRPM